MQRHRHQEFIRFLNAIEREVPAGKLIHVILDNYAAHKHPKVIEWLGRHPRFTFHFTPTSASWLNAVEGFFAKLTKQRLKRGVFHSLVSLQAAINRYVAQANDDPRPFRWTKDPDKIIAAVRRGHQVLNSHPLVRRRGRPKLHRVASTPLPNSPFVAPQFSARGPFTGPFFCHGDRCVAPRPAAVPTVCPAPRAPSSSRVWVLTLSWNAITQSSTK